MGSPPPRWRDGGPIRPGGRARSAVSPRRSPPRSGPRARPEADWRRGGGRAAPPRPGRVRAEAESHSPRRFGEGVDRLLNVADRLEESEDDGDSLGPISVDPNLMALVGFASELPDIGRNAGRTVGRMAYPMVRAVGVTADTVGYLLEITDIKAFWADLSEPARSAIADELELPPRS